MSQRFLYRQSPPGTQNENIGGRRLGEVWDGNGKPLLDNFGMKHDFAASPMPRRNTHSFRGRHGRQRADMVCSMDFCGEYA
jgi:hypothetical protein